MDWWNAVNMGLLVVIWTTIVANLRGILRARVFWLLFFFVYTVTEVAAYAVIAVGGKTNLFIYNRSRPIQFVLVAAYLLSNMGLSRRNWYKYMAGAIVTAAFLYLASPESSYNSLVEVIFYAITLIICLFYFDRIIKSDEPIDFATSEFWFSSALFVYFGTAFWITGLISYLMERDRGLAGKLFFGLVISSYFLYGITLYALYAQSKSKPR